MDELEISTELLATELSWKAKTAGFVRTDQTVSFLYSLILFDWKLKKTVIEIEA